jgi:hypothetical protein
VRSAEKMQKDREEDKKKSEKFCLWAHNLITLLLCREALKNNRFMDHIYIYIWIKVTHTGKERKREEKEQSRKNNRETKK